MLADDLSDGLIIYWPQIAGGLQTAPRTMARVAILMPRCRHGAFSGDRRRWPPVIVRRGVDVAYRAASVIDGLPVMTMRRPAPPRCMAAIFGACLGPPSGLAGADDRLPRCLAAQTSMLAGAFLLGRW